MIYFGLTSIYSYFFFSFMIITIENIIRIVPNKWAIVKLSPRIKNANIADAMGVGANKIVAFDTSK